MPHYKCKGGGTGICHDYTILSTSKGDHSTVTLPSGPLPSKQCTPTIIRYDPLTATTYFNNSSTLGGGGGFPTEFSGPRLAIESDIQLAAFPTITSCLANHQFLPNDVYNSLDAIAENIDA